MKTWAQNAVERPEGSPLPPYEPTYDPEPPTDHLSFALGVALGRFGPNGQGILDPEKEGLAHALAAGLLFLDRSLDDLGTDVATGQRALGSSEAHDGLFNPAAKIIHDKWASHGPAIGTTRNLRDWLALDFFKDVHKGMYEDRPIHWPLSSDNRTFVAWVNIHRWNEQTFRILLADHLAPALTRLEGQLDDLREARQSADKKAARSAEKRFDTVKQAKEELDRFITDVEQCADRGPLPPDARTTPREQDHVYAPDLDDGVMINSAALWKLLEPQWRDPKKWWKELADAKGKKDYDWSHLAMRYFPKRVDAKCRQDPSLGVAHGCFWRYHPARAWAWELRLQDEIGPDFRIEEAPYRPGGHFPPIGAATPHLPDGDEGDGPHRERYLTESPAEALEAIEKEAVRRMGRGKKRKLVPEMRILESGIWTALPEEVYAMELRLSERQGAEFKLLAPDEPEARAAYEAENPKEADRRLQLLAGLTPPAFELDEEDEPEEVDEDLDEEEVAS